MFQTSPILTALSLAVLPAMLAAFQIYAKFNRHYTSQSLTASAAASVIAEECFGSIRTVSASAAVRCCACADVCMCTACTRVCACTVGRQVCGAQQQSANRERTTL